MALQEAIYTVDPRGKILSIKGDWDEFAHSNGGENLLAGDTIGRNLFLYISGDGVIEAYRTMHVHLLDEPGRTLRFRYRCDSPAVRRDMRMVMENDGGAVRYTSTLLDISPLDPPVPVDYAAESDRMVMMCAWCKRVKYPLDSSVWHDLQAIFELVEKQFSISHGICPSCCNNFSYLGLTGKT